MRPFDSEVGSGSGLNAYPNASINGYGSISGVSALQKEFYQRGPIACRIDASFGSFAILGENFGVRWDTCAWRSVLSKLRVSVLGLSCSVALRLSSTTRSTVMCEATVLSDQIGPANEVGLVFQDGEWQIRDFQSVWDPLPLRLSGCLRRLLSSCPSGVERCSAPCVGMYCLSCNTKFFCVEGSRISSLLPKQIQLEGHPSSEMHLGRFPDHTEFQSWIVNFRTEVCSKAKNPTRALQWIKEIEAAKSLDDLFTPKSTTGKDFPDYEELDLMLASALKMCYDKQTHFRKKISVEEQRGQKDNRSLRGTQNCLFDL